MAGQLLCLILLLSSPLSAWEPGPVHGFAPVFAECSGAQDGPRVALRRLVRHRRTYLLLADPGTLETSVAPAEALSCRPLAAAGLDPASRLARALAAVRAKGQRLQNAGLVHSQAPVRGFFLTVDLCPSPKPGIDEVLFQGLQRAMKAHGRRPLPVALAVSGGWLKTHGQALRWFLDQQAEGRLALTWVNHTLTHPFDRGRPLRHNFLLEPGADPRWEVLGMEKLLLERGLVPSVFFRFPGLVSDQRLVALLDELHLVSVGSDAWLAKGQRPRPGSVILVHGNRNEPGGVARLFSWLQRQKGLVDFLPLGDLAARP